MEILLMTTLLSHLCVDRVNQPRISTGLAFSQDFLQDAIPMQLLPKSYLELLPMRNTSTIQTRN
jgi:hypothetical protein